MNIFAKKYIQSLVVYEKIDIMKTKTGECIYIVTYDLTKNQNSRFINVLKETNLCCAYRNWFMNFIFIEKNVKERKDYLVFLYHEIGHVVHHDLYRSNIRKHKSDLVEKTLLANIECEKNADLYAFENSGIRISAEKICEYIVWAQDYIVQIFQPEIYETLKNEYGIDRFRQDLYKNYESYINANMSARFE